MIEKIDLRYKVAEWCFYKSQPLPSNDQLETILRFGDLAKDDKARYYELGDEFLSLVKSELEGSLLTEEEMRLIELDGVAKGEFGLEAVRSICEAQLAKTLGRIGV